MFLKLCPIDNNNKNVQFSLEFFALETETMKRLESPVVFKTIKENKYM